jgi:hypothetical protein
VEIKVFESVDFPLLVPPAIPIILGGIHFEHVLKFFASRFALRM